MNMSETVVSYRGLTHRCDDPNCHVVAFVRTLKARRIAHPDPDENTRTIEDFLREQR